MRIGPDRVLSKLDEVSKSLDEIKKVALSFLKSVKDKVEAYHRNAFVISFETDPFFTIHALSPDGRTITAQTLSDPFNVTPSPFKTSLDIQDVPLNFKSLRSGVMEFPPRTRFLALVGDDGWISKVRLYEEIKGIEYLSFAFKMDDETYERLRTLSGSVVENIAHLSLDDEGLNVVISAFSDRVSLLAEMAKVIRDEMNLKTSKYSKLPKDLKVLTVFKFDLEEVLDQDVMRKIKDFVIRLKRGYESFLEGAGLV